MSATETAPKRVVTYARISLDTTGEGKGVERQVEACQALALARGWTVVAVEEDNSISATNGKHRPAWERVLGMVERGEVDIVLSWALDRITRSMLDLESLIGLCEKHDVAVATVTGDLDLTTDTGRMLARILGAVARGEVERKGARQKAAYAQAAKDGRPHWAHRPFGLTRDGDLHPVEAPLAVEAYERVLGGSPLNRTATWLNGEPGGIPVKDNGTPRAAWTGQSLGRWLRDARNAGIRTYNGTEVGEGNWVPIVSEATYRATVSLMGQPSRRTGSDGKRVYLLTGVGRCGECDGRIKGGTVARTGPYAGSPVYSCPNGHVSLPVEWADGRVFNELTALLEDSTRREHWRHHNTDAATELAELRRETDRIVTAMEGAGRDLADGVLDRAVVLSMQSRYREQLDVIEGRRRELGEAASMATLDVDTEYVAQELAALDTDAMRSLLVANVERVTLHRRGRGQRGLAKGLVEVSPR